VPATPLADLPGGDRVRVVREQVPGISAARNRGVTESSGDIVAFTDDDVVVEPGWLRALGARFAREPELDGVGGLVLPSELDTEAQLWFEEYYGGFSQSFEPSTVSVARTLGTDALFPYAPGRFGAGCNMAFRRSTLEAQGGFDTVLGTGTPAKGGEDLSFFIRVLLDGGSLGFEPAAVVRHSHRRTEPEFLQQVLDYGTGLSAMYTSLLAREPRRHLVELARRVPPGLKLLVRPRRDRSTSRAPSYPRRTLLYQLAGIAYGPVAYARSARAARTTK
jgi:GT2 family glycosyltransferase